MDAETAARELTLINVNFSEFEDYVAPKFKDTVAINAMHNTPRMGNTNDITLLLTGTDEEKKSYVVGLFAMSVLILTLFFTWTLVLLILKCLGQRVGCASGAPRQVEYDNVFPEKFEEDVRKAERSLLWTRLVFLLSGVGAVISAVYFVHYGIGSLRLSVEGAKNSVYRVSNLTNQLYKGTDVFLTNYTVVSEESTQLDSSSSETNFCPVLDEASYIADNSAINQTLVQLKDNLATMNAAISNLQHGVVTNAEYLRNELNVTQRALTDTAGQMDAINIVFYLAIVMAIFQTVLVVLMMLGVLLAWCEKLPTPFRCAQSYILLPVFLLSMAVSIVFSVVFVIGATTGSDFCYPTPDATVQTVLRNQQENIGPFAVNVTNYYVSGCTGTDLMDFDEYVNIVADALESAHTFVYFVNNNTDTINQICNGNAGYMTNAAKVIHAALHAFAFVVDVVRRLFFCSNINGLYTQVVYNVICDNAVTGMYEIFTSQLLLAIFSMIMVTLRVSWQQLEE